MKYKLEKLGKKIINLSTQGLEVKASRFRDKSKWETWIGKHLHIYHYGDIEAHEATLEAFYSCTPEDLDNWIGLKAASDDTKAGKSVADYLENFLIYEEFL